MAVKTITMPEIGEVRLQKRRGTRSIRLSIDQKGIVRVGLPSWLPFKAGYEFVLSHRAWIAEQQAKQPAKTIFKNGDRIGKAHTLRFIPAATGPIKTRLTATDILVTTPASASPADIQAKALSASERALKKQAEALLPQRLRSLANVHGFSYRSVAIKKLKTRWGSCSAQGDIALNYFLMQLPWELIDYVLLHELNHTEHLHHQKDFWDALIQVLPDCKARRKALKQFQPAVITTSL